MLHFLYTNKIAIKQCKYCNIFSLLVLWLILIKKIYFFILFLFLSLVSVSDKYHCLREIIAEIYHTLLNISLQYFMKSAIHLLINLQGFGFYLPTLHQGLRS